VRCREGDRQFDDMADDHVGDDKFLRQCSVARTARIAGA
jgi:hypothetical protein